MPQILRNITRLDSIPLTQTHYTAEGYLVDRPIVTSTGIFEYIKPDGTVRRELRLPEDVFDPESLKSYRGKPIIVTHDAGLITKKNVSDEQIGTIMSDGYRSGNDVRAEIIIHDTMAMKSAGLKELSLGYNLDLEEEPGEWNGQPYDAIQHNIRINHLALVGDARAGERARLNIDSRDTKKSLEGVKSMKKTKKATRADGILTPEELAKAVEEYKARRANRTTDKQDEDMPEPEKKAINGEAAPAGFGELNHEETVEEKVETIKANKERRDEECEPVAGEEKKETMAKMDEDIGTLLDIIDTLLAERDFDKGAKKTDSNPDELEKLDEEDAPPEEAPAKENTEMVEDSEEEPIVEDEEDELLQEDEDEEELTTDEEEEEMPMSSEPTKMNTDSVDRIVRERIKIGIIGQKLNMDGLENKNIMASKKSIIRAVRPSVRLDGKSAAYINAAFDMACEEVNKRTRKGVGYQKKQMFNRSRMDSAVDTRSSANARQRMIERQNKKED